MLHKTKGSPTDVDVIIGQNLKKIRKSMGVSQSELADKIGITFQQIQKYEKGVNRLAVSRLIDISHALNVNVSTFYDNIISPNKLDILKYDETILQMAHKISLVKNKEKLDLIHDLIRVLSMNK